MDFDDIFNNSFEKKVQDKNVIDSKVGDCRNLVLEKFGDIKFIEESHQYFINDEE